MRTRLFWMAIVESTPISFTFRSKIYNQKFISNCIGFCKHAIRAFFKRLCRNNWPLPFCAMLDTCTPDLMICVSKNKTLWIVWHYATHSLLRSYNRSLCFFHPKLPTCTSCQEMKLPAAINSCNPNAMI